MGNIFYNDCQRMQQFSEKHRKSLYRLKGGLEEVVREEISTKIQEGVSNISPLGLGRS